MSEAIGFIGIGAMGKPIAKRLIEAGYRVSVYNRTPSKAAPLVEQGARQAASPAEAVESGGIAITMLSNDEAAEAVTLGDDGVLAKLGNGVHISMSTISPDCTRRLASRHDAQGGHYVAAPVFGRPDAAAAGKLWVVQAGPEEAKQRTAPLFEAFSQGVYDYGNDPSVANVVKLAGNFLIASAMEAMAEAFTLAEKNGVDRQTMAGMFADTLFGCPIYKNYGAMIAEQRYSPPGFTVDLGFKDMDLVRQISASVQAPMPFVSALLNRMLALRARGRGGLDWSAVGHGVSEDAGTA